MTQDKKAELNQVLSKFTPEEQGMFKAVSTMKVENRVMKQQLAELKAAYDTLYATMITLLHAMPERELRLHQSQFLRFKAEYRIDQKLDGEEVVLKLLTLTDDVT